MMMIGKSLKVTRALRSRPYALLWIGQTISSVGDGVFTIALAWQVLLMTHSGLAMGTILVAATVPRLIFVLIGGVTADRLPRRLIMLWSDGGRGLVVMLISILGFMGQLQFWHLIIEAFIFGIVSGFFNPAEIAIMPELVEKEDLASANAFNSFSNTLAQLVGPVLGAGLIAVVTPMGAFLINAVSYFISAVFLLLICLPKRPPTPTLEIKGEAATAEIQSEPSAKRKGFRGVISDILEGFAYVRRSRWLWVTTLSSALGNIGFMATLAVAMPKLVHDVYQQGAWLLGCINVASAIGSLIGLFLVGQATHLKKRGLLSYLSLTVTSLGILIFGLPFPAAAAPVIASIASLLVGFGLTFFNTIFFTVLQETVPGEKLGCVLSLDMLGSFAMIPVGEILGGIMTDRFGAAIVFTVFGLFNLSTVLLPLLVREVRDLE